MISKIKQAIIDKLAELYPSGYLFHEDKVPQKFKSPAFIVLVVDHEYGKRMNTKYKGVISFDVAYFSDKNQADVISDCLLKQEALLRGFDRIGTYRAVDVTSRITDNVLHVFFNINYSEMKTDILIPMQTETVNTNL